MTPLMRDVFYVAAYAIAALSYTTAVGVYIVSILQAMIGKISRPLRNVLYDLPRRVIQLIIAGFFWSKLWNAPPVRPVSEERMAFLALMLFLAMTSQSIMGAIAFIQQEKREFAEEKAQVSTLVENGTMLEAK